VARIYLTEEEVEIKRKFADAVKQAGTYLFDHILRYDVVRKTDGLIAGYFDFDESELVFLRASKKFKGYRKTAEGVTTVKFDPDLKSYQLKFFDKNGVI
jgi:hypothetical protein